jgi:hypothetical protein
MGNKFSRGSDAVSSSSSSSSFPSTPGILPKKLSTIEKKVAKIEKMFGECVRFPICVIGGLWQTESDILDKIGELINFGKLGLLQSKSVTFESLPRFLTLVIKLNDIDRGLDQWNIGGSNNACENVSVNIEDILNQSSSSSSSSTSTEQQKMTPLRQRCSNELHMENQLKISKFLLRVYNLTLELYFNHEVLNSAAAPSSSSSSSDVANQECPTTDSQSYHHHHHQQQLQRSSGQVGLSVPDSKRQRHSEHPK